MTLSYQWVGGAGCCHLGGTETTPSQIEEKSKYQPAEPEDKPAEPEDKPAEPEDKWLLCVAMPQLPTHTYTCMCTRAHSQ